MCRGRGGGGEGCFSFEQEVKGSHLSGIEGKIENQSIKGLLFSDGEIK